MGVSIALSLAALVFRGPLEGDYGIGAGWALLGMLSVGLVVAFGSSIRGLAAGPQDAPAVVIGAVGASLAAGSSAPVATLAAFVVMASATTGLVLLVLGRYRLGGLVRFVPFPVVAGFLGGTGVVLALAGLDLLAGGLTGTAIGFRLAPGLALGAVLVVSGRRAGPAILPAALVLLGVVGYHVAALVVGIDRAGAVAQGLVLGPFPDGDLLDLGMVTRLGEADWAAVAGQVPAMLVLALLVALGLLLNIGALEHELGRDGDMNRELVVNGVGLLVAAPLVGLPGYAFVGDTVLGRRIGGDSRVPVVVAASMAGVVLLAGPGLLAAVPVLVPGGLLVGIGVEFVLTWVWDVRGRVRPLEHLVVIAIVVVVATVGFLQGVALGVVAASILFIVRYSRVRAVRASSTLRERRSRVQRPPADEAVLDEQGHRVSVVELQGFVFFGTAEQATTSIVDGLAAAPDVERLVLDLHHVTGMDSSADAAFRRLARATTDHGLVVVVSGGGDDVRASLDPVVSEAGFTWAVDLDRALEDCEEWLLATTPPRAASTVDEVTRLWEGAAVHELAAGSAIVTAGQRECGVFLLEQGRAAVEVGTNGSDGRHALLLPGTVVGELSLLTGEPANATVVCQTDCVVRHLSTEAVTVLALADPDRALALYRFLARRLAAKLAAADRTITSLR